MTDPILYFRGEYHFLSNFYPSEVEMDGQVFPTVEHAYQAAKSPDFGVRKQIASLDTPKAAKAAGRRIKRPKNWFAVNLGIMESLVRQKFTRHADLHEQLLATGDAELVEGNVWNDRFFGMIWNNKTGEWVGENHLGKILMRVRAELQAE